MPVCHPVWNATWYSLYIRKTKQDEKSTEWHEKEDGGDKFIPRKQQHNGRLDYIQFSSITQSCPTLCDPMDCSTPGFPVQHQLPEVAQTHVHQVGDAIQPSHPLSSPSPLTFNLSQHQGLLQESVWHIRWPKYWSFSFSISYSNGYSVLISFRMDWFDLLAV